MPRFSFLAIIVIGILVFFFGGGGDKFPDYHYKMTFYTKGGTFSTVRAVTQREVPTILDSSGWRVKRGFEGQAGILSINGRTYYALLTQPNNIEYAVKAADYALLPHTPAAANNIYIDALNGDSSSNSLDRWAASQRRMVKVRGPVELPRTRPNRDPYRGPPTYDNWPTLVTFGNPQDPATVREITPEQIGLAKITVEITDDDVSSGIENTFPWWEEFEHRHLDGSNSIATRYHEPILAARLTRSDFRAKFEY